MGSPALLQDQDRPNRFGLRGRLTDPVQKGLDPPAQIQAEVLLELFPKCGHGEVAERFDPARSPFPDGEAIAGQIGQQAVQSLGVGRANRSEPVA